MNLGDIDSINRADTHRKKKKKNKEEAGVYSQSQRQRDGLYFI